MKTNTSKIIKVTAVLASLAGIVTAMGFGCGMGFQPMGAASQNGFADLGSNVNQNQDLVVVEGTKTVGITNYTSVLDAMTSITNVPPSTNTKNVFNQKLASFSESKSALGINAPMLLSYVAVGAEVCNDLLTQENGLAAANRRFFTGTGVNLATNSTSITAITDDVLNDWIRRFARSAWGRNETPEELAMIKAGIAEMKAQRAANFAGLSRHIGLYTCTATLASTSGYEI
jgi:hypothetical protein